MSRAGLAGVLVLAVAVLAVVVAPNLSPRAITGIHVSVEVPGPPAIGDCVLYSGSSPWNPRATTPDVAVAGTSSYSYPRLRVGPCTGTRYGEVVAIIPHPVKPVVTVSADGGTTVVDPNVDRCQLAARRYIGAAAVPTPMFTFWSPIPMTGTAASMPSVRQQAAGQHWLACITFPLRGANADGVATDPPGAYVSRLQGALLTGADRDLLGSCVTGIDLVTSDAVGCAGTHQGEMFGYGSIEKPASRAELQHTCREVIAKLTRLPDITAGGALAVQLRITADNDSQVIRAAQVPADASAVCGLNTTGHGHLHGSLLALGRNPIPWA